ncbi:MAG: hypothetical protein M3329_02920, partial [Pseudomonadota bacterium]|nr:hypothetical protein [Pseudomonadota bacterium]
SEAATPHHLRRTLAGEVVEERTLFNTRHEAFALQSGETSARKIIPARNREPVKIEPAGKSREIVAEKPLHEGTTTRQADDCAASRARKRPQANRLFSSSSARSKFDL